MHQRENAVPAQWSHTNRKKKGTIMNNEITTVRMNLSKEQQDALAPLLHKLDEGRAGGAILINATRFNMTARIVTAEQCQQINQALTGERCTRFMPTLRLRNRRTTPPAKPEPGQTSTTSTTEPATTDAAV
jgi:hypothetical protein